MPDAPAWVLDVLDCVVLVVLVLDVLAGAFEPFERFGAAFGFVVVVVEW